MKEKRKGILIMIERRSELNLPVPEEERCFTHTPKKAKRTITRLGFRKGLGLSPANNSNQLRPVGGRLTAFLDGWKKITSDQWILGIIQKGLKLSFQTIPEQRGVRVTRFGSREQNKVVKKEIQELLEKLTIEKNTRLPSRERVLLHLLHGSLKRTGDSDPC